jgi:hypothetical protein
MKLEVTTTCDARWLVMMVRPHLPAASGEWEEVKP